MPKYTPMATERRPRALLDLVTGSGDFLPISSLDRVHQGALALAGGTGGGGRHQAIHNEPLLPSSAGGAAMRLDVVKPYFELVLTNMLLLCPISMRAGRHSDAHLTPSGLSQRLWQDRANILNQFWKILFLPHGKPVPFHTAEDLRGTLAKRERVYRNKRYRTSWSSDAEENRLKICGSWLGSYFDEVPRRLVGIFNPYAHAGRWDTAVHEQCHLAPRKEVRKIGKFILNG